MTETGPLDLLADRLFIGREAHSPALRRIMGELAILSFENRNSAQIRLSSVIEDGKERVAGYARLASPRDMRANDGLLRDAGITNLAAYTAIMHSAPNLTKPMTEAVTAHLEISQSQQGENYLALQFDEATGRHLRQQREALWLALDNLVEGDLLWKPYTPEIRLAYENMREGSSPLFGALDRLNAILAGNSALILDPIS